MAFGCAHSADLRANTENSETSVYFQKAWALLPNLLMDNDLWALKAMTLIVSLLARLAANGKPFSINFIGQVHYLQASAKPEASWSLLGTALQMSISLNFHRKISSLAAYSEIKREGKRAFWLCYTMEK